MPTYLESSRYIDWHSSPILHKAKQLTRHSNSEEDIVRACFEFVRDHIKHSLDHQLNPITCKASDVLHYGTGYCYAKSHLLAALLRANNIPAALCYQRLTITGTQPPFCLHGLNTVYLQQHGWYRLDARGNKPGVQASFSPPHERLAYPITNDGEADLTGRYAEPLPSVIEVLNHYTNYQQVADNLPDISSFSRQ